MQTSAKICMIVYGKLRNLAQTALTKAKCGEESVFLVDAMVDQIHQIVDESVERGCEVFIAGSANAAEVRRYSGTPLVELRLRPLDFAIALRKALRLGSHPALVVYKFANNAVRREELSLLLEHEIELIVYETTEELLEKLAESQADVIVGASQAVEVAESMQKKTVFVYPGEAVILDALRRAQALIQVMERERRNSELMQAVISESKTGIIGFSERRQVLLINAAARRMTGLTTVQAQNGRLRDIISEQEYQAILENDKKSGFLIKRVHNRSLQMQLVKMERSGRNLGALLLIEELSRDDPTPELPGERTLISLATFKDLVVHAVETQRVITQAKALPKGVPLTITGEYGVGKAMLAQCIHSFHYTGQGDYVVLNCATIPRGGEANLFYDVCNNDGKEAMNKRLIDLSTVGTLVLENIWEASPRMQSCLLWMIDGAPECFVRNGEAEMKRPSIITLIPNECRKACAEHVRQDLLHRLRVACIAMPPLRNRKEDIPGLFAREVLHCSENGRIRPGKASALLPVLNGYSWSGNVNELNSVCRRYLLQKQALGKLTATGEKRLLIQCIGEEQLLEDVLHRHLSGKSPESLSVEQLSALVQELKEVLLYSNEQIAEKLQLSRTSIWRKLRKAEEHPPVAT